MATPYVGECRLVGFNFAPNGWNLCDGSLVAISENDTLFNLIGTTYGGDGSQTFGLPDLRGRVPVHGGASGMQMGEKGGAEMVTLSSLQMPVHTHPPLASFANATSQTPQGNLTAGGGTQSIYVNAGSVDSSMNAGMISNAGNSQPHDNMQPYLVMNWVISLFGIFPTRS